MKSHHHACMHSHVATNHIEWSVWTKEDEWQGCWACLSTLWAELRLCQPIRSSSCFCSRRMITKIGEDQMTWPAPKVHFDHWASPVYLWKILSITNNFTSLKKIFWLSLLQNANYCHIKTQQNLEFLGEFHGGAKSTWIWRNSLEIWILSNFQHNLQTTFWHYNKVSRLGLG